jgi:hypothetical protein
LKEESFIGKLFYPSGATEWKMEKAAGISTPTYHKAGKVDFQGEKY